MAISSDRLRFYPVEVGVDLLRGNMFEIIFNAAIGTNAANILRIMCKSFNVQLPSTNDVSTNWMSGLMHLAGRQNKTFNLSATFLVGVDSGKTRSRDALAALYEWRNMVMDHTSGVIHGAWDYKRNCTINIYDITGEQLFYVYKTEGLWPSDISDFTLNVEQDQVIELQTQFLADRAWLELA